jgi:GAF domain protein
MNKETTYTALLPQIAALIKGETNETSVLANVAAALHQAFDQFFGRVSTYFTPMACCV